MNTEKNQLTNTLLKVKEELKESLSNDCSSIVDHLDDIGYDDDFIFRLFSYFKEDIESTVKFLSLILSIRQRFNFNTNKISKSSVESSIKDNFAFWFKRCKSNYPTLIIKVKNSLSGKQSVNERISFGFYLFEQGLYLAKSSGVNKFSIIYDRTDFDKEKNFDERIPKILKRYLQPESKELFESLFEWIDNIYVLNIGFIYRAMFEVYKTFKKDRIFNKIKLLSDNSDLKKYFHSDDIPTEYAVES